MTVISSIIRDNYSLIATDTRILLKEQSKEKKYEDRWSKLADSGFGWLAGMGYNGLIVKFNELLKSREITNINDIYSAFDCAYQLTKAIDDDKQVDTTSIVYSYNTDDLQIGVIGKSIGRKYIPDKNVLVTLLPDDSEELKAIEARYKKIIEDSSTIEDVIYNNACYFEEVASKTDAVSTIIEFGIMSKANDDVIEYLNIREPIETIKYAYENGSLMNHVKLTKLCMCNKEVNS